MFNQTLIMKNHRRGWYEKMNFIAKVVDLVNTVLWDYALLFLLVGTGIFYTVQLKFVQVRKFGKGMKLLFGNISFKSNKNEKGLSSFQALTTAIAAQVGTGNIAGAATAIAATSIPAAIAKAVQSPSLMALYSATPGTISATNFASLPYFPQSGITFETYLS